MHQHALQLFVARTVNGINGGFIRQQACMDMQQSWSAFSDIGTEPAATPAQCPVMFTVLANIAICCCFVLELVATGGQQQLLLRR